MASLNETIKYLDLTGLVQYDALIKKYSDDNDAVIMEALETAIGEGGDVATQITKAINALKGTLSNSDAATLEAINDELDGIDSALETLNGSDSTAGSVAKAVKDGIAALDYTIPAGSHTDGKPVTAVSETDGIIAVTEGNIKADYVTVDWGQNDPVSSTSNVQASLEEIYGLISTNEEAGEVAVYKTIDGTPTKVNAIAADGSTYTIKQGTDTVATINIARDMVVSQGAVVTADGTETDVPTGTTLVNGKKYVRLVIANSTDGKNVYIPVDELYDDYTFTDGDEIDFTESNNEVTASIKTGSIAKTKLTTALQNEISAAATVVNAKSSGHVQVSVTAASGANPAEVTVTENDIASAQDLSGEVTRAQSAEGEIADKIGLTGNEGSKVYSSNVGGSTVIADINTLDGRVDNVETFIGNLTAISKSEITALFTVPSSGD